MENKAKSNTENPNGHEQESSAANSRTPFTNLSQVDADLALARTLQEQERAYMMLRMNGGEGGSSDYATSEGGSYVHDDEEEEEEGEGEENHFLDDDDDHHEDSNEDAFDFHQSLEEEAEAVDNNNHDDDELDPSTFTSDEAYARALQDAEDRELAARMMALTRGLGNHWEAEDLDDNDDNSQDTWEEVDPDELSYEELLALGEVVGIESRGLSADTIASLPSVNYKAQSSQDGSTEQCVICRLEYEDEDTLTVLSCKHTYHPECINNWLQINKVCPVCSAEVSASENR